ALERGKSFEMASGGAVSKRRGAWTSAATARSTSFWPIVRGRRRARRNRRTIPDATSAAGTARKVAAKATTLFVRSARLRLRRAIDCLAKYAHQVRGVERLAQPTASVPRAGLRLAAGRHQHDWNASGLFAAGELVGGRQSIHPREPEVEENHVRDQ